MRNIALLALVLQAGAAHAGERAGLYLGVGFGGTMPGTGDFLATNDVQLPGDDFETIVSETIDLDPDGGVAFGAWLGWQATDFMALEVEGSRQGFFFNDSLVGDDDFDLLFGNTYSVHFRGANVVLAPRTDEGWQPYVGVGAGQLSFFADEEELEGIEDDKNLGYQLKAGLSYHFRGVGAMGLQIRHIVAAEPFEQTVSREVIQPETLVEETVVVTETFDYTGSDILFTFSLNY